MRSLRPHGRSARRPNRVANLPNAAKATEDAVPPACFDVQGLEPRVLFAIITVTGVGDTIAVDGQVTLREAITAANTNAVSGDAPAGTVGLDTIRFNIAPAGTKTISPTSPLPVVTDRIFIDGTTQPGAVPAGTLKIELRGSLAGAGADGLFIRASNSRVRGMVINRFAGDGIELFNANNCVIDGNYLGTDRTGMIALGNGGGPAGTGAGITMNSGKNRVGTNGDGVNDAAERNVISANGVGVRMNGANADANVVAGNAIGVNRTGTAALGNRVGVQIMNGADINQVGTDGAGAVAAERNVISGNRRINNSSPLGSGVEISNKSHKNVVAGNYIGTNAAGTAALPNDVGVSCGLGSLGNVIGTNGDGVGDFAERNVISRNLNAGIRCDDQTVIAGNYIGTAANGVNPLGNGGHGVFVRGSFNRLGTNADGVSDVQERNVIANNGINGVLIQSVPGAAAVGNVVAGNFIGTTVFGAPASNLANGVMIVNGFRNMIGGPSTVHGNVIANSRLDGVYVQSGASNSILTNSIYHNGFNAGGGYTGGLGIDLGPNGVTPNDPAPDPDGGANNLQNFPEIFSATNTSSGATVVKFQLISDFNQKYVIQFFVSPVNSPSLFGEGQKYLGSVNVATNAVGTTGTLTVTFTGIPVGQWITATATLGNLSAPVDTSEFSFARQVV